MKTFTKTATFTGSSENLDMFAWSGIQFASKKQIIGHILKVTWICEDENTDIYDYIDLRVAEMYGIDMVAIEA